MPKRSCMPRSRVKVSKTTTLMYSTKMLLLAFTAEYVTIGTQLETYEIIESKYADQFTSFSWLLSMLVISKIRSSIIVIEERPNIIMIIYKSRIPQSIPKVTLRRETVKNIRSNGNNYNHVLFGKRMLFVPHRQ